VVKVDLNKKFVWFLINNKFNLPGIGCVLVASSSSTLCKSNSKTCEKCGILLHVWAICNASKSRLNIYLFRI
jgi:hypothetical protein